MHANAIHATSKATIACVGKPATPTIQALTPLATAASDTSVTTIRSSVPDAVPGGNDENLRKGEGECGRWLHRAKPTLIALMRVRRAMATRPPGAARFNPAEPDTHRLRLNVPTTRL